MTSSPQETEVQPSKATESHKLCGGRLSGSSMAEDRQPGGSHLPQENSLPRISIPHQGKTLNTSSQGALVIWSTECCVDSLLVTSVSATEKRPHLPGNLLTSKLCAETGISQVIPDNTQFKRHKEGCSGWQNDPYLSVHLGNRLHQDLLSC